MVTLQEVEKQLEAIGANNRFWGRAEIIELQHILIPGEKIQASLNGRYQGGNATFVATDQRLLLIDKKIFYLTVEDMRYDMIAEVDFNSQLLSGTLRVCTPTKNLSFTAYRPKALRQVATHIQQRVMEVRHQYGPEQVSITPEPAVSTAMPAMAQPVTPPASVTVDPTQALNGMYAAMLGNQAIVSAEHQPEEEALPLPRRRNPYMNTPLITRRRIGRFGPIGTPHTPGL